MIPEIPLQIGNCKNDLAASFIIICKQFVLPKITLFLKQNMLNRLKYMPKLLHLPSMSLESLRKCLFCM